MMMWWWMLIPVVLIWVPFVYNGRIGRGTGNTGKPIDIRDSRFARGEISKEEYEEQKKTLNTKN